MQTAFRKFSGRFPEDFPEGSSEPGDRSGECSHRVEAECATKRRQTQAPEVFRKVSGSFPGSHIFRYALEKDILKPPYQSEVNVDASAMFADVRDLSQMFVNLLQMFINVHRCSQMFVNCRRCSSDVRLFSYIFVNPPGGLWL